MVLREYACAAADVPVNLGFTPECVGFKVKAEREQRELWLSAGEIRRIVSWMQDWCRTKSYQPDGSFEVSDLDDTQGGAYGYGIWFLQEAGYFQRRDRFWTDQDFPDSKAVQERIETKLKSTRLNDPALKEAYDTLHAMD